MADDTGRGEARRRVPGQSLSVVGLRARDGLDCPAGGAHRVRDGLLALAAARGGGTVKCQDCGQDVVLEPLDDGDA
jgi:hypothetical protein